MKRSRTVLATAVAVALVAAGAAPDAGAEELQLYAVQAPERQGFTLELAATRLASAAKLEAKIELREGQARIEASFEKLKPAVLFGGDVTSYVMWAVTHDGKTENLGELWVRNEKDSARFATGLKDFALLVTAESHFLVDRPSELVVFYSLKPKGKKLKSRSFSYSAFAPEPPHQLRDISNFSYTGSTPLDLLQAEKALELAQRMGAEEHAADAVRQARLTLAQARSLSQSSGSQKLVIDYARRSVAMASEAMRMTQRIADEQRLAAEAARRLAEKQALESRASDAESARDQAELAKAELAVQIDVARDTLATLSGDRDRLSAEMGQLARDRSELEATTVALRQEAEAAQMAAQEQQTRLEAQLAELEAQTAQLVSRRAALEANNAELETLAGKLRDEKNALESRLQGALSTVATTRSTARGLVVSLPDILFDVDRATLKPDATLALAKLSGIVALMHELNLRIEGHTDSTGSAEHNQRLSESRARAVADFLRQQGVAEPRLSDVGYGMTRPIADNASREGRAKNRRVEIVIAEGEVPEGEVPEVAAATAADSR